jgi:hypothetical protein
MSIILKYFSDNWSITKIKYLRVIIKFLVEGMIIDWLSAEARGGGGVNVI